MVISTWSTGKLCGRNYELLQNVCVFAHTYLAQMIPSKDKSKLTFTMNASGSSTYLNITHNVCIFWISRMQTFQQHLKYTTRYGKFERAKERWQREWEKVHDRELQLRRCNWTFGHHPYVYVVLRKLQNHHQLDGEWVQVVCLFILLLYCCAFTLNISLHSWLCL